MLAYQQVFIGTLDLFNCIYLLVTPSLRPFKAIYCKRAGLLARFIFGKKLQYIPNYYYALLNGSNYVDVRACSMIQFTTEFFADEQNKYLKRFYEQSMASSLIDDVGLIQDSDIMTEMLGGMTCILLPVTPFLATLQKYYGTSDRQIRWCFGKGRIKKSLRTLAQHGRTMVQAIWSTLKWKGSVTQQGRIFTVSVRNFRGGLTLAQRSDLFWMSSRTEKYPIIFEYAQPRYLLSDDFLTELKDKGIRIVESHSRGKLINGSIHWRPSRIFLGLSIRSILRLLSGLLRALKARCYLDFWKVFQKFHFEILTNIRLDYYRTYNVKAELLPGFTLEEPAHSYALFKTGGISCVTQYSVGIDPVGSHTSTSTFHLHFGSSIQTWDFPFFADYNILNGYTFKTPLIAEGKQVEQLRKRLIDGGASHVVCFLDEGFEPPMVADVTFQCYGALLKRVIMNDHFGLVIKPKKSDTIRQLQGYLGTIYHLALATGRVIILDWNYYPGIAGQAADLTIGLFSTAAFEPALIGCRVIYFNPFSYVPSFATSIQGNIYSTVEDTMTAMEQFFHSPTETSLGRHTEDFLKTIDHYRDAEASQRIEYLLMTYLEKLGCGKGRDVAIKDTLRGFSSRWNVVYSDYSRDNHSIYTRRVIGGC